MPKKALTETSGDFEAAVDWLRTKGLAKAAKKSDRVAAEGLVAVFVDGPNGVAIEVNSETDFVAKNEEFINFSNQLNEIIINKESDSIDQLLTEQLNGSTVESVRKSLIGKIGENISIRRASFKKIKWFFFLILSR